MLNDIFYISQGFCEKNCSINCTEFFDCDKETRLRNDFTVMKTNNNRLPNIVYYNDDHSKTPECTTELSKNMGATYTTPSTWSGLTDEIEHGKYKIIFHLDMIDRSNRTLKEFIDSIKTIIQFMPNHKPLRIFVIIKPDTPRYRIDELKEAGVLGLGLDINYYPVEEIVKSCKALVEGTEYYPEHIINKLPKINKKPINLFFSKDVDEYINRIPLDELQKNAPWEMVTCNNWDSLGQKLKLNIHQLVLHPSILNSPDITIHEYLSMIDTLLRLNKNSNIPVAMGIDKTTPIHIVKELQKTNVHGIVPTTSDFGVNETYKGLESLFNRIPYWPKHILEQLPGSVKKQTTKNSIKLTQRQLQVLNLILERGLTNKKIAKSLNITESTVKIHVSSILKAYGVRTRTQLVVMSQK